MPCSASGPNSALVSGLADYIDCHASAIGQNAFEGATNGFLITAMLTGCLTIYVALIGYRLVLGQSYTVREALLACVRVGLIITFCTRWPSYEAVFYRTVVEGPQEIASEMIQSPGMPASSEADIVTRLGEDYQTIQAAANKLPLPLGPATSPQASAASVPPVAAVSPAVGQTQPSAASLSNAAISIAGLVFLISTVGSLMAVHLAAALLIAVGPMILLLALFDSLVGLLENWVAALAGTIVATVGIMIVTELELGFVESKLLEFNANGAPALTDQGLLLTALVFSLCIVGVLVAAGLVGRRLKFRGLWLQRNDREVASPLAARPSEIFGRIGPPVISIAPPSRALAVANAVSLQGRRERMLFGTQATKPPDSTGVLSTSRNNLSESASIGSAPDGLGYTLRRPASPNRSISYARRGQRK